MALSFIAAAWSFITALPGPVAFPLALATLAVSLFIANEIDIWLLRKKPQRGEVTIPSPPIELLPSTSPPPFCPPPLTAAQATQLIGRLRDNTGAVQIKIVSTFPCMEFAKNLIQIFRQAGYHFVLDQKQSSEIFPAAEHGEIICRYRKN